MQAEQMTFQIASASIKGGYDTNTKKRQKNKALLTKNEGACCFAQHQQLKFH